MKFCCLITGSAVLSLVLLGCGSQPTTEPAPAVPSHDDHDRHDHHAAGPHGGTIVEWGGGAYHIEFTVDHAKQEAVVYVLGADAKKPAPVKTDKLLLTITTPSFQMDLAAQPLAGESDGTSSRFAGNHEALGQVREFAGSITGEVEGTPYTGDFQETAEGHAHKH